MNVIVSFTSHKIYAVWKISIDLLSDVSRKMPIHFQQTLCVRLFPINLFFFALSSNWRTEWQNTFFFFTLLSSVNHVAFDFEHWACASSTEKSIVYFWVNYAANFDVHTVQPNHTQHYRLWAFLIKKRVAWIRKQMRRML